MMAYNSKYNGTTKRFHSTFNNILALIVRDHVNNWDHYLQCALYTYRTMVHKLMGYSSYYRTFGEEPIVPSEVFAAVQIDPCRTRSLSDHIGSVREILTNNAPDIIFVLQNTPQNVPIIPARNHPYLQYELLSLPRVLDIR